MSHTPTKNADRQNADVAMPHPYNGFIAAREILRKICNKIYKKPPPLDLAVARRGIELAYTLDYETCAFELIADFVAATTLFPIHRLKCIETKEFRNAKNVIIHIIRFFN